MGLELTLVEVSCTVGLKLDLGIIRPLSSYYIDPMKVWPVLDFAVWMLEAYEEDQERLLNLLREDALI